MIHWKTSQNFQFGRFFLGGWVFGCFILYFFLQSTNRTLPKKLNLLLVRNCLLFPVMFLYEQFIQLWTGYIWTVSFPCVYLGSSKRNHICLNSCSAVLNKALLGLPQQFFQHFFTSNSSFLNTDEQNSTQYFKLTVPSTLFNGFNIFYHYFKYIQG